MRSFLSVLVPAAALSLSIGAFACSGADSDDATGDDSKVASQLVDEGHTCSAANKCKPGLACVAHIAGGDDISTKGVPCADCGGSSSSSTGGYNTSSSSGSGWSSSTSSSGSPTTSSSSSGGWSSSTSSSGGPTTSSSSSGSVEPDTGVCVAIK